MMKKIIKPSLALLISLAVTFVVGCSNTKNVSNDKKEKSVDSSFIDDLEKALEKRWDFIDDVEKEKVEVEDDIKYIEKLLSYEKELYKYIDEDFNDQKLKAVAEDYLSGLKDQEESIKYYNVDFIKHDELWNKGYNERSISLLTLVEEYGLNVSEEQFQDLKTNAQLVNEQNAIQEKVDEMVRNITFNKVKTEYDWTTYSATLENTSGVDLEGFSIEINLLDANGVIIGTESSYHDNTWKPGQKVLFEFETDITGFEKMEWEAEYYIPETE
jgi:hypothetical protein